MKKATHIHGTLCCGEEGRGPGSCGYNCIVSVIGVGIENPMKYIALEFMGKIRG